MKSRRWALGRTFSGQYLRRAIIASYLVGTVLNVINQGDAIMEHIPIVVWKFALTYLVPFLIVSGGSYAALRNLDTE